MFLKPILRKTTSKKRQISAVWQARCHCRPEEFLNSKIYISPVGMVPKPNSVRGWRIIRDLSFSGKTGFSVNELIPADGLTRWTTFDVFAEMVRSACPPRSPSSLPSSPLPVSSPPSSLSTSTSPSPHCFLLCKSSGCNIAKPRLGPSVSHSPSVLGNQGLPCDGHLYKHMPKVWVSQHSKKAATESPVANLATCRQLA
ncbi:hypothetical protein BS47DRAFT_836384 [Hydnum rufescens UP504]|uniref:Uncharacterized protein n=1 Tax=Hydnum rufescens UP504 TaxID=1448309 RepID=A0A9P6DEZ4_9AGAM|nr:hypothetical protein BS47DRAFT_836384 [Hydnum rufescens UP504]